ncbi:hypothetical protein BN12_40051 [Nostocoides japonicum T1-X7]|uniref:Phage portal protein n=1 Tax=Nostocoides japonicum T1-X7 TaxID=1194083 RepID=A0A077LZQ6_9MICO|nr:phage portal protein [Tetrasphaera japonica]CCH79081.1 hypothetical protein BN12_40051 [Tetrasphaera japonica T1-X7]
MGFWRTLRTGEPDPALSVAAAAVERDRRARVRFSGVVIDSGVLYGTQTWPWDQAVSRVSRRDALTVPAVKRARDLVVGTLGSLPLDLIGPGNRPEPWTLFEQPEEDTPRTVSMTRTFEDLLFEGTSWWLVQYLGWHGMPVKARRLDPGTVNVPVDSPTYRTAAGNSGMQTVWRSDAQLIRFDSPNDPLLVAGARAIRACIALDAAALRNADGSPPVDYFTPTDVDLDDDEVDALNEDWAEARKTRSTAYIPSSVEYHVAGWDPEKLQLAEARQHAVLEIARLAGVDPEDLGVSTTSRTYFNAQDRIRSFVNGTLAGYLRAVEDRLSMPDVTPPGFEARFNLSDLLKADDTSRITVASQAIASGLMSRGAEARAYFDPTLPPDAPAITAPAPAPALEPANA